MSGCSYCNLSQSAQIKGNDVGSNHLFDGVLGCGPSKPCLPQGLTSSQCNCTCWTASVQKVHGIAGLTKQLRCLQQPAQSQPMLFGPSSYSSAAVQRPEIDYSSSADATHHAQQTVDTHSYATATEDSLAAIQRQQILEIVKGITQYLQQDLVCMQQTCKALMSRRS